MGVYQSKTEPEVRAKTAKYSIALDVLDSLPKPALIRGVQKKLGVPARIQPVFHYHYPSPWLAEMRFEWFEVVTD